MNLKFRWWGALVVVSALSAFSGPTLVIHGREDRLIPWQWGQRLAASAKHATFRLYECGHGCWDPDHNSFWVDADALLESAGIVGATRPAGLFRTTRSSSS